MDQWNSDRLAVVEEATYVSRLTSDIDENIKHLEQQIDAVCQKQENLAPVAEQLERSKRLRTTLDKYLGTLD